VTPEAGHNDGVAAISTGGDHGPHDTH
jgi:hypothetical protein